MNNELISREAALEMLNDAHYGCTVSKFLTSDDCIRTREILLKCIRDIEDAPAVDAEPVRHGVRTVYTIWHSSAWGEIHTKFECCGFDVRGTKKYNYCPNCGAKVDGDA